jgi:hypothetical protein
VRRDLQLSCYPQGFIGLVIKSKNGSHPNKEENTLGSVRIPYVRGVSEKFKHIGNRYNIRTIFKTKHTFRSSLIKNRPEKICNRRHTVSTSLPVNVAEATLAKQADV